jgi:hypothetical protein
MPERSLIVDQLKLSYEGLFNLLELYRLIDSWFYEKGWDKFERMNEEQITPEGRQITILLEPWKSMSDHFKLMIRIKLHFRDVKDVEVEKDQQKIKINQGEIKMIIDGYLLTDRRGQWKETPFQWFLVVMFNKYFFKQNFTKAEKWLNSDIDDLYQRIKSYLNVYKYQYQT